MDKLVSIVISIIMLLSSTASGKTVSEARSGRPASYTGEANSDFITVFNDDGKSLDVSEDEANQWEAVGWHANIDDARTLLYDRDGSITSVWNSQAESMLAEGWVTDPSEIQTTLYSEDGRELTVLNSDVPAYLEVGWFRTLDEVQTTLYSEDGRELTVFNSDVPSYLEVGWFRTLDEVQTTLYSEDGRELTVFNSDVSSYLEVGWFRTLDEVQTTLYSEDGRELTVFNSDVPAYLEVGWFLRKPGIDPTKPMVALTFDDGPGPYTDRILDVLTKYDAKATFFVVGNRLGSYSSTLKRQVELGMEIGCHTWNHTQLTTLDRSGIASQISSTNNKVHEITGLYPSLLRPPYGSYNSTVREVSGAPIIMWSIDTLDWKTRNADSTYKAVMNNVKDGDIILMHDIHSPTADAVERIVPALVEKGYQLVTVSELGYYKKGGLVNGQAYSRIN